MHTSANKQSRAPRLHNRRRARVYVFPWVQLLLTTALALSSLMIGTPWPAVLLWWGITAVAFALQDLATQESLLTNFCFWLLSRVKLYHPDQEKLLASRHVFSIYPEPPLYANHQRSGWVLSVLVLLATWGFALYQGWVSGLEFRPAQALLTALIMAYGIIPYGLLIKDPMKFAQKLQKLLFWTSLGVVGAVIGSFSFVGVVNHYGVVILASVFVFFFYTTTFVALRLWAGEQVLQDVLQDVSMKFLSFPLPNGDMDQIPEIVGRRLRHNRVYILEPVPDEAQLRVTGCYGNEQVRGKLIPLEGSLTGRVFQEQSAIVWNSVDACPYHHRLEGDDTKAEMAVPIVHQSAIFGVLDVQSEERGVYGAEDIQALETIARILGAAIAVHKRNEFFVEAVSLWGQVLATNLEMLSSEEEVFKLFAGFMRKRFNAEPIIYFPLSLAGCPVRKPYTWGEFNLPKLLKPPRNDAESSLIKLITDWQPYYEQKVTETSLVARSTAAAGLSFVKREGIKSTCFIPVGTRRERLGALVLNFREPKEFDMMFRFTVLSLAQSLSKITAQIRYRRMSYESFGRPELTLHGIIGRHGLKDVVLGETAAGQASNETAAGNANPLLQMKGFLQEVYLAESAIPPNFWQTTLRKELITYRSDLPMRPKGPRPDVLLRITSCIERESPWVKLALYRLITEAINNAIFHADATRISVDVQRTAASIEVEVVNNGTPLAMNASGKKSKNGIFSLQDDFEQYLGAATSIRPGGAAGGAVLSASIPALPFVKES